MSQIELTYKSKDTEEIFDILFYRPIGYRLALLCEKFGISPNSVTILSIFCGAAAGYFFIYENLTASIAGILLLLFAETLDSTDGQLARITNTKTRYGRIMDGVAGNIIFFAVYVGLSVRFIENGTAGQWIFMIAVISGFSHSLQCAMADYYRNAYLYFIYGINKSEFDRTNDLQKQYQDLRKGKNFFKKCLMYFYINYTVVQEKLSSNFQKLVRKTIMLYGEDVPENLQDYYKVLNKPLLKYYNILTTNTRMIVLIISILINQVYWFFLFEIVILNILLVLVTMKQERISEELYEAFEKEEAAVC